MSDRLNRMIGRIVCCLLAATLAAPTVLAATECATWAALKTACASGGEIVLTADVTQVNSSSRQADSSITLSGKTVTIDLNGHTLKNGTSSTARSAACSFILTGGANLTVTGIGTLDGGSTTRPLAGGAFQVAEGCTLTIGPGVTCQNWMLTTGSAYKGGIVYGDGEVFVTGGSFFAGTCSAGNGAYFYSGANSITLAGGTYDNNPTNVNYGVGVKVAEGYEVVQSFDRYKVVPEIVPSEGVNARVLSFNVKEALKVDQVTLSGTFPISTWTTLPNPTDGTTSISTTTVYNPNTTETEVVNPVTMTAFCNCSEFAWVGPSASFISELPRQEYVYFTSLAGGWNCRNKASVTVAGIPFNRYDVYVYFAGLQSGFATTDTDTPIIGTTADLAKYFPVMATNVEEVTATTANLIANENGEPVAAGEATYWGRRTENPEPKLGTNVVKFNNQTGDTFKLAYIAYASGVAAVQVVERGRTYDLNDRQEAVLRLCGVRLGPCTTLPEPGEVVVTYKGTSLDNLNFWLYDGSLWAWQGIWPSPSGGTASDPTLTAKDVYTGDYGMVTVNGLSDYLAAGNEMPVLKFGESELPPTATGAYTATLTSASGTPLSQAAFKVLPDRITFGAFDFETMTFAHATGNSGNRYRQMMIMLMPTYSDIRVTLPEGVEGYEYLEDLSSPYVYAIRFAEPGKTTDEIAREYFSKIRFSGCAIQGIRVDVHADIVPYRTFYSALTGHYY